MGRGPLGGPRPFADSEIDIVMDTTISTGALESIEEGKRDVTDIEVAEIEAELRESVLKSFGSGPATTKMDVENVGGRGKVRIYLGDSVKRQQIKDIENTMERAGYKIADYTIRADA